METPNIHQAISSMIGALPGIGKDSKMQGGGQNYRYRSIEHIKSEIADCLPAHGLHYYAAETELVTDHGIDLPVGAKSDPYQVVLRVRWVLAHTSGQTIEAVTFGHALDNWDKAFNKAMTAAEKYFLLTTFCIADGDDPDHEIGVRQKGPTAEEMQAWSEIKGRDGFTDVIADAKKSAGIDGPVVFHQLPAESRVALLAAVKEELAKTPEQNS